MIYSANQLTGFYIMATLAFNELMSIASEALNIWILILKNLFARYVFIYSLWSRASLSFLPYDQVASVVHQVGYLEAITWQKKLAFHPAALLKQQVTKLMVSD